MFTPKSEEDLRKLAIDYVEGRIYTSLQIQTPWELRAVFMPLVFLTVDQLQQIEGAGLFFEYLSEAAPGSINGKPIFMSMNMLSKEDAERFADLVNRYLDYRKAF